MEETAFTADTSFFMNVVLFHRVELDENVVVYLIEFNDAPIFCICKIFGSLIPSCGHDRWCLLVFDVILHVQCSSLVILRFSLSKI